MQRPRLPVRKAGRDQWVLDLHLGKLLSELWEQVCAMFSTDTQTPRWTEALDTEKWQGQYPEGKGIGLQAKLMLKQVITAATSLQKKLKEIPGTETNTLMECQSLSVQTAEINLTSAIHVSFEFKSMLSISTYTSQPYLLSVMKQRFNFA